MDMRDPDSKHLIITGGDPAGIGPLALQDLPPAPGWTYTVVGRPQDFPALPDGYTIHPMALDGEVKPGHPSPLSGAIAYASLVEGVDLAVAQGAPLLTLPVDKAWVAASQPGFVGHTRYLAQRFETSTTMLMHAPELSVALMSEHVPLGEAPQYVTEARLVDVVIQMDGFLTQQNKRSTIAVLGLNPHAGERGHLGREDLDILEPTVQSLQEQGFRVEGPFSPDSFWAHRLDRDYQAVVAMYHDQGLIPAKLLYFDTLANITLGLPIRRASPDHGPCYDRVFDGQFRRGSLEFAMACLRA